MAVVKGPLMSIDARKSVGKTITFTHNRGRNVVRKLIKPKNPKSPLQVGMRAGHKFISQVYKNIGATPQANWKAAAKLAKRNPLNQMVSVNSKRTRQGLGWIQDPTLAAGAVEAAPTALAVAALPKSLLVTWVDSVGAADWTTLIWMSTTTGFTPSTSTLIAAVPKGTQTLIVPKLVTGTPYYFRAAGSEKGGTLGTLAAQVTGTPT